MVAPISVTVPFSTAPNKESCSTDTVLKERKIELKETTAMLRFSGGDARKLLNILELVVESDTDDTVVITDDMVTERLQQPNCFISFVGALRKCRGTGRLPVERTNSNASLIAL